jgi:hypothetical protein
MKPKNTIKTPASVYYPYWEAEATRAERGTNSFLPQTEQKEKYDA